MIYSGYYTFELTKDGVTKAAKAKFSYVYVRKPGVPHLLITTHNSGITPQGVTVIATKRKGAPPPPPPISVEEVTAARDAWVAAVQSLDVMRVVNLYDTENVRLLGTVDTEDNKAKSLSLYLSRRHLYFSDRLPSLLPSPLAFVVKICLLSSGDKRDFVCDALVGTACQLYYCFLCSMSVLLLLYYCFTEALRNSPELT